MTTYFYTAVPWEKGWELKIADSVRLIGTIQVTDMSMAPLLVRGRIARLFNIDDHTTVDVKDATLWALHIQGPDDIIPMPDYTLAHRKAEELNHVAAVLKSMRGTPDLSVRAVVIVWSGTAGDHAEAIRELEATEPNWYDQTAPNITGFNNLISDKEGTP